MNYKLSPNAAIQLEEIYIYTVKKWDVNQAEIYNRKFENNFGLLTEFPHAGAQVDEYKKGLRQFGSGKHFIFYSVHETHILIEYILHKSSKIRDHFEA